MTRPARLLVSGVLAVVLALLAVPLVGSFLPAVQEVLREPAPAAEPAVPKQQLPPEALSGPSTVTPLSAAAPLPALGCRATSRPRKPRAPAGGRTARGRGAARSTASSSMR
ncbi:hypothetical protein IWX75_000095 [Arthrobacter sp. CAN_A6]|uniref:hypothetical protein n=1 Tax=Arthrobacter sp. CAN_A6 TaxID=2787721 RepID=UPI001A1B3569